MDLRQPPEPVELKEEVLRFLDKYPESRQEGGHSVADAVSYWYGNKLPRYLWKSGWGLKLQEAGVDRERFMRTIGAHRSGFFRWIDGDMTWDRLIELMTLSVSKTARDIETKTVE